MTLLETVGIFWNNRTVSYLDFFHLPDVGCVEKPHNFSCQVANQAYKHLDIIFRELDLMLGDLEGNAALG